MSAREVAAVDPESWNSSLHDHVQFNRRSRIQLYIFSLILTTIFPLAVRLSSSLTTTP